MTLQANDASLQHQIEERHRQLQIKAREKEREREAEEAMRERHAHLVKREKMLDKGLFDEVAPVFQHLVLSVTREMMEQALQRKSETEIERDREKEGGGERELLGSQAIRLRESMAMILRTLSSLLTTGTRIESEREIQIEREWVLPDLFPQSLRERDRERERVEGEREKENESLRERQCKYLEEAIERVRVNQFAMLPPKPSEVDGQIEEHKGREKERERDEACELYFRVIEVLKDIEHLMKQVV
jgi:hypothetical protein